MGETKNGVYLIDKMGSDKTVCLSAWQSTTEELGIELPPVGERVDAIFEAIVKTKKKSPEELIKMLAESKHETPFEKVVFHFQVTSEIASHIHILKHRIASANSESARYKEFINDRYYIPDDWKGALITADAREEFKNLGINVDFCETWAEILAQETERNYKLYHMGMKHLPFKRKRKKESARFFLGYNTTLNYDFMLNARSFINFQNNRNDSHAQDEIHWISQDMLQCIADYPGNPFKYTLEAFKLLDKLPKKESYVLENSEVFTFKVTRAVPWTDIHGNVREDLP